MDWLPWAALTALGIGIWHEINRFPATDKTFRKLMERIDKLESENYDLREKLKFLDSKVQLIIEKTK